MAKEWLSTLKLFNEKAKELLESRFVQYLYEHKKLTVKISFKKGEQLKIQERVPDEHAIKEFVLTLRLFKQKREKISIRKMASLYSDLPVSAQLKKKFSEVRRELNEYLDSAPHFKFKGKRLTRRQILDIILYGKYAHLEKEKKEVYDRWMKSPLSGILLHFDFVSTLTAILRAIRIIASLNDEALEELARNPGS